MIWVQRKVHLYSMKRRITVTSMLVLLVMLYFNLAGRTNMIIYVLSIALVPFALLCDDQRIRFDKSLLMLILTYLLYVYYGRLSNEGRLIDRSLRLPETNFAEVPV